MMVRVTNYFETQIRVPASSRNRRSVDGTGRPSAYRARSALSEEQIVSWYATILDGVRIRYRKLQRFSR
jgi:mitogen-activated protein kinase kinase kinase